jgi:hypothetical protein
MAMMRKKKQKFERARGQGEASPSTPLRWADNSRPPRVELRQLGRQVCPSHATISRQAAHLQLAQIARFFAPPQNRLNRLLFVRRFPRGILNGALKANNSSPKKKPPFDEGRGDIWRECPRRLSGVLIFLKPDDLSPHLWPVASAEFSSRRGVFVHIRGTARSHS